MSVPDSPLNNLKQAIEDALAAATKEKPGKNLS